MGLFRYYALTDEGRKEVGIINAESIELAKEKLKKQKILVTKLTSYKKKTADLTLSPSVVLHFTRDIQILLKAGLPLYDCLLTLEEKYRHHGAHSLFLDLCDLVKQGRSLSSALQEYPKIFDPIYYSMVKAGEESGSLEQSFLELTRLLGKQVAFKKKVSSAMIYPCFLGVFCFLILIALLFFLIPSMKELFEDRALHPVTEFILHLSTFLNEHSLSFFSLFFFFLASVFLFFRHKKGKQLFQSFCLRVPIVNRLITETILARFCRVFSVLLHGGLTMIDALHLSKQVMNHGTFEEIISSAEKKVVEGKRLSEEFKQSSLMPNLIIRMLAIAEESGDISKMMQHIAEIYEENVERSLSRLISLLQPMMLLFLGLVVAIILLAVLLPLTDVSSMIN